MSKHIQEILLGCLSCCNKWLNRNNFLSVEEKWIKGLLISFHLYLAAVCISFSVCRIYHRQTASYVSRKMSKKNVFFLFLFFFIFSLFCVCFTSYTVLYTHNKVKVKRDSKTWYKCYSSVIFTRWFSHACNKWKIEGITWRVQCSVSVPQTNEKSPWSSVKACTHWLISSQPCKAKFWLWKITMPFSHLLNTLFAVCSHIEIWIILLCCFCVNWKFLKLAGDHDRCLWRYCVMGKEFVVRVAQNKGQGISFEKRSLGTWGIYIKGGREGPVRS